MENNIHTENKAAETVVIFGDWFIDENWLIAKHNSYSSTNVGDIHFISKQDYLDKRMISLCGAAEIMEVLKSLPHNKHEFIGFGCWNANDDDIIQCMLCPHYTAYKFASPYTISSLKVPERDSLNKRKCPYKDNWQPGIDSCRYENTDFINLSKTGKDSTDKIIRCFEGHRGGDPHLLYRFDWLLPIGKREKEDYKKQFVSKLNGKSVRAVVIEDHNRGIVNEDSISALREALIEISGGLRKTNTKWYIRAKAERPDWINSLMPNANNDIEIRLWVMDYNLARYIKGQRKWFYGRKLGRAALEILGELTGEEETRGESERLTQAYTNYEKRLEATRAAILFDENTVIAKDKEYCYNLYKPAGSKQLINVGRTSIFYSALIAQDLSDSSNNFGTQCHKALICAHKWSERTVEAWENNEHYFYGQYDEALKNLEAAPSSHIESGEYKILWEDWNVASKGIGIVNVGGEKRFQVWRGEGLLEGYICVAGPKRDAINDLIVKIFNYKSQKENKHPLNCLLVGSPGWGKSFLAKSLATHFDMPFIEFSISQMASTNDLVDCLDAICSYQNRIQKRILIFIDEINCEIEGNSAMGLLLNPIWDGSFLRNGKTYRLAPAVWIFATTETKKDMLGENNKNTNKGSDFISRLSGPIIELDSVYPERPENTNKLMTAIEQLRKIVIQNPEVDLHFNRYYYTIRKSKGSFKTEQVYIGISLLNSYWGPISKVDEEILWLFYNLIPINGFRSMEYFVSQFINIQNGVVLCKNVPRFDNAGELKRHIILPRSWKRNQIDLTKIPTLIEIESVVK